MLDIINVVAIIVFSVCWVLIIVKLASSRLAPVKTIKAQVIEKHIDEPVSKYPSSLKGKRHIIVFQVKNERLSFAVSEFSYNYYKIREKGTLKYKGSRLISFR